MYKYNLNDIEWGIFKVGDLFEKIEKGRCSNENLQTKYSDAGISYLSATNRNNGVSNFVKKNSLFQKGNCIMFVNQGDGGAGFSVYKFEDFIATTSTSFGYAGWINKNTGLFVSTILSQLKNKYSFGYGRTEKRLSNDKIKLPIDDEGKPNWQFMEGYIKEREQKQIETLTKYYSEKLNDINMSLIKLKKSWGGVEYKEFFIGEVFNIASTRSGIDKNKLIGGFGKIPYITRSEVDNGINLFVSSFQDSKYKKDSDNVITIGLDTQTVFYQKTAFYTGQNIQILQNQYLNEYVAMFLIPLLKFQLDKLNWGGNGATLTRLKRTKILLPSAQNNKPNWDHMEEIVKNIEAKKISKIIQALNLTHSQVQI